MVAKKMIHCFMVLYAACLECVSVLNSTPLTVNPTKASYQRFKSLTLRLRSLKLASAGFLLHGVRTGRAPAWWKRKGLRRTLSARCHLICLRKKYSTEA